MNEATHATPTPAVQPGPSTRQLVDDLRTELDTLVRDEIALAREEMAGKTRRAIVCGALLAVAAVTGFYGGGCVLAGVIIALQFTGYGWQAPLLVGAVLLVFAGALALVGAKVLRAMGSPLPAGMARRLRMDVDAVLDGLRR